MPFITAPRKTFIRKALWQIHLWLGLIIGPIVGIVALTGAVVVFRYELNRVTTPGTAYVEPRATPRLTMDDLYARLQTAHPGDRINQANWGENGPELAFAFRSQSPDGHRIHTYVNQYTGEIIGRDDYQWKFMQIMYNLHAELLGGKTGEFLNGFVGLAAVILGISGLIVWWPGKDHWKFGFSYKFGAGWKRQNYDLHKVVGFYTSIAFVVVALSGMYYSFPDVSKALIARATGTPVVIGAPKAQTSWDDRQIPMERFLQIAEQAQPGTYAISMSIPSKAADPVTVRTKEPKDWHRIGLNYVYLEPSTGAIIRSDRFSEVSTGTQIALFMYPLHFGRFGGRLNPTAFYAVMAVYVVIGVAPFALMITGFLMYWNRSFSKKWRRWRVTDVNAAPAPLGGFADTARSGLQD